MIPTYTQSTPPSSKIFIVGEGVYGDSNFVEADQFGETPVPDAIAGASADVIPIGLGLYNATVNAFVVSPGGMTTVVSSWTAANARFRIDAGP